MTSTKKEVSMAKAAVRRGPISSATSSSRTAAVVSVGNISTPVGRQMIKYHEKLEGHKKEFIKKLKKEQEQKFKGRGRSSSASTSTTGAIASVRYTPSPAVRRQVKRFQEKFKRLKKQFPQEHRSKCRGHRNKDNIGSNWLKGKSYKSKDDRKLKIHNPDKIYKKKFVLDSKIGGRNTKTAFGFRKYDHHGSDVFKKRADRIYSVEDSDEEREH